MTNKIRSFAEKITMKDKIPIFAKPIPNKINHPSHYTDGAKCSCGKPIECIDVVQNMSFCRGNAIKYLWRAGKKESEIEDLKKSLWYIQREIELLTNQKAASTTGKETGKETTPAESSTVGDLIVDSSF